MRLDLCLNCLQSGAQGVSVGPDKGDQRDPYRVQIPLCETCETALLEGDFQTLADRQVDQRVVRRGDAVDH